MEAGHGKVSWDSLGASVKRVADTVHAPLDDPSSFIQVTAYFTMLSGLIFRPVEGHICLSVSTHGL